MRDRGMGFPNHGADDQGWKLYITSLVMILSAGLFVIARCTTRFVRHAFGWDDVTIIASLAFSILEAIAIMLAVNHGYGMHKADLAKDELEMTLKWFFIAQTPYKVVVCLNKVAVILLYLRIFVSKSFRLAAFVVMFIVVGYSIGGVAATIFQCVPIKGAWLKNSGATCINSDIFWVAYAVLNIVTDVLVLALPIWPIMKLQLGWRDRFLLCGVFLLGIFVTITSILRVTSVQNSLKNRQDQTYNFIERGIWTQIEANLGIISACLPVLKHPLSRLFPRLFGSITRTTPTPLGGGESEVKSKSRRTNPDNNNNDNWSTTPSHNRSNPRFWRGPLKHELNVSISANRPDRRGSDEHHIIGGSGGSGINIGISGIGGSASDKGGSSETIELDERDRDRGREREQGRNGDRSRGISKTVELTTRVSFHDARGL